MSSVNLFIAGYITAALWSSTDENGEPLDANYSISDLDADTRTIMERDCIAFFELHSTLIEDKAEAAGHDLWLTRCGHGAGFWDGDWPEPAASVLDAAAEALGNVDLFVGDDGLIYA